MAEAKQNSPINTHVAQQIKKRRKLLGVSQKFLAGCLGITFQQVQKYEKGSSRISVGRLYEIAKALNTSVTAFFAGFTENKEGSQLMEERNKYVTNCKQDEEIDKDLRILMSGYYRIRDPLLRKKIVSLIKQIVG